MSSLNLAIFINRGTRPPTPSLADTRSRRSCAISNISQMRTYGFFTMPPGAYLNLRHPFLAIGLTTIMRRVNGLHHITAIAGPAQENLDFYAGILGMRLVKRSINQDDPGTYHLFYADAEGHPGTDLTFFPWAQMAPPRLGHGLAVEVALEVPTDSLAWWGARLEGYGVAVGAIETRFGDRVLPLVDPHGMRLALTESARGMDRVFAPWSGSPIPVERQIRGLYGAQLWERDAAATAAFVTGALGF